MQDGPPNRSLNNARYTNTPLITKNTRCMKMGVYRTTLSQRKYMKQVTMNDKQYADYMLYLTNAVNIQDVKKPNKKEFGIENKHPTIKPEKLMEWLIKLLSNEGDTVLDCFNGSGTTGVAATRLERRYVGIEMNPDYAKATETRIGTEHNSPSCTIITGECVATMKTLPPNSVDCVITDPPYNVKMADWDVFKTDKEFGLWCQEWATECYRILKPGGTIASFSAARTYHYMAMGLSDAGFQCRDMIEWIYWSGMPKGKNLKQCHEPIYLGWKPEKNLANLTMNIDACRIPVKEKKQKDGSTKVSINNLEMTVQDIVEPTIDTGAPEHYFYE
jgi:DNA modification methylase